PGKGPGLTSEEGRRAAEAILETPITQRLERSHELHLEDPEQLLSVCTLLWAMGEVQPARARDEAAFFYGFIETPKRPIGIFDERDYYLGDFALIAGGTCRILSKREEAKRWFRSEERRVGKECGCGGWRSDGRDRENQERR